MLNILPSVAMRVSPGKNQCGNLARKVRIPFVPMSFPASDESVSSDELTVVR
jgi:hypothetical protein